jgi:hypothetical protein
MGPRADIFLQKTEASAISFSMSGLNLRLRDGSATTRQDMGSGVLRRFAHNLRRESDFFIFFARNPLKSPDSDE